MYTYKVCDIVKDMHDDYMNDYMSNDDLYRKKAIYLKRLRADLEKALTTLNKIKELDEKTPIGEDPDVVLLGNQLLSDIELVDDIRDAVLAL